MVLAPPDDKPRSKPGFVRQPLCGAFAEPSDGLEPSTPSLPSASGGLPSVARGCGSAYVCRFWPDPICERLPPVAPAWLHKRSILWSGASSERTLDQTTNLDFRPVTGCAVGSDEVNDSLCGRVHAQCASGWPSDLAKAGLRPRARPPDYDDSSARRDHQPSAAVIALSAWWIESPTSPAVAAQCRGTRASAPGSQRCSSRVSGSGAVPS